MTLAEELRQAAADIETAAQASRCWSVIERVVANACSHITSLAGNIEKNDRLYKLEASISDAHDVPPEHESEPVAFHKGWELAVRKIACIKPAETP
jgi:hypothetical protein